MSDSPSKELQIIPHCPVCAGSLEGRLIHCPRCETQQHEDCKDYLGGCAIYACDPNLPKLVETGRVSLYNQMIQAAGDAPMQVEVASLLADASDKIPLYLKMLDANLARQTHGPHLSNMVQVTVNNFPERYASLFASVTHAYLRMRKELADEMFFFWNSTEGIPYDPGSVMTPRYYSRAVLGGWALGMMGGLLGAPIAAPLLGGALGWLIRYMAPHALGETVLPEKTLRRINDAYDREVLASTGLWAQNEVQAKISANPKIFLLEDKPYK